MIRISSKRHNFRRCGMAHPKGPVEYPDGRFTEEELSVLQAEPMLTVEVVAEEEKAMTVPELKERLTEMGVEFPSNAKKQDLVELLETALMIGLPKVKTEE